MAVIPDRLFRLDGKIALVTGGGTGLGAAAAEMLAAAGAVAILAGRTASTLTEARKRIEANGGRADTVVLDVSDPVAVDTAMGDLAERHGGVDVLVNNAGVQHQARTVDTETAAWREVIEINLDGTFYCSRAFARLAGGGCARSIVNVSSFSALAAVRGQPAYCASKGGIVSLTRAMALELAADGIRVNALAPGYFRTGMPAEVLDDPHRMRRLVSKIPVGRVAEPEEIGGPVLFLASDASSYLTGAVLSIDGGITAH